MNSKHSRTIRRKVQRANDSVFYNKTGPLMFRRPSKGGLWLRCPLPHFATRGTAWVSIHTKFGTVAQIPVPVKKDPFINDWVLTEKAHEIIDRSKERF